MWARYPCALIRALRCVEQAAEVWKLVRFTAFFSVLGLVDQGGGHYTGAKVIGVLQRGKGDWSH